MKILDILLVDHIISKRKVQNVICRLNDYHLIDITAELRKHIEHGGHLTAELDEYINAGEVIPIDLIEKLIQSLLNRINSNKILLYGYPKNGDQYHSLERLLKQLNFNIDCIWFIKQRDSDAFMNNYFKDPNEKVWVDKFGGEVIERMKMEFLRIRGQIDKVLDVAKNVKIKIIEMDYEPILTENIIENKIKTGG